MMDCLEKAKIALSEQLSAYLPTQQPISCLQVKLEADIELLAWLKAQSIYPQFYLNLRDSPKVIAAIGKVRSFSDINTAQDFVQQSHFPLLGGVKFYGESQFILPQMLLEIENGQFMCSLFVENTQISTALAQLENLTKYEKLADLPSAMVWQKSQKADKNTWCYWVEKALAEIKQEKLNKIVLANETIFQLNQSINAKDFLHKSEQQNWGCYHFLFAENEQSSFVGSSPERLFSRSAQQLFTEALAGTALIGQDPEQNRQQGEWLLSDPKNLAENWLVVEDISQNIQDTVQKIDVMEVALKPLRNVQHLIRKITATIHPEWLKNADAKILQRIHPTAAVSGLPQQQAKQILSQIENFNRDWYAGTLGIITENQSEFCVTIRSAFIEKQQIRIFAGAGIVADSKPQEEWNEIERKAEGLISLLQHN